MEKIETIVPTLNFIAISGDALITFKPDGVIEFGEKYRNNPDAAAQEFVRLVAKLWPELVETESSAVRRELEEARKALEKTEEHLAGYCAAGVEVPLSAALLKVVRTALTQEPTHE